MTLAEDLKRHLVGDCGSVSDVADKLGVGRPAVSNMLNGNSDVSIEMALRIEKVFAMDAGKILHRQLDEKIEKARANG